MPAKGNDRKRQIEQQAKRTLRGLIRMERIRSQGIYQINLNSLEKSLSNLIYSLSGRLSQKMAQSDVYLKDLERLDDLSKLKADDISHAVINQERALLKRYFNLSNHYKISLIEKYYNNYLKLSHGGAGLTRIQQDNIREERQNYRTSLEGAHSSLLSLIRNKALSCEKKYISEILTRFNQFITKQFREMADRVRTCNQLQMPAEEFLRRGKKNKPVENKKSVVKYEQATLQNREQEKFYEEHSNASIKKRTKDSDARSKRYDQYAQDILSGKYDGEALSDVNPSKKENLQQSTNQLSSEDPKNNKSSFEENKKSSSNQLANHTENQSVEDHKSSNSEKKVAENNRSDQKNSEGSEDQSLENSANQEKVTSSDKGYTGDQSNELASQQESLNQKQQSSSSSVNSDYKSASDADLLNKDPSTRSSSDRTSDQNDLYNDNVSSKENNTKNNGNDLNNFGSSSSDDYEKANSNSQDGNSDQSSQEVEQNTQVEKNSNFGIKSSQDDSLDQDTSQDEDSNSQPDSPINNQENSSKADNKESNKSSGSSFFGDLDASKKIPGFEESNPNSSNNEINNDETPGIEKRQDVPDGAKGTGEMIAFAESDNGESSVDESDVDSSIDQFNGSNGSIYDLLLGGGKGDANDKTVSGKLNDEDQEDSYEIIPDLPSQSLDLSATKSLNNKIQDMNMDVASQLDLSDDYLEELVEDIISNRSGQWSDPGLEQGTPVIREKSSFTKYFDLIDECSGIQKLLKLMGKSMGLDRQQTRRIHEKALSEDKIASQLSHESFSGITLGNEISYVLPEDMVKITDDATEPLFDISYLERNLLSFDLSGFINVASGGNEKILTSPRHGRGPVVLCVDTSSSMKGIPESYAKAIAMSLALKCRSAHRDCYIINFSVAIEKMLLKSDSPHAVGRLSHFLSKSFDGGSDLDEALFECLALMKNDPRFFHSDVLCITDGQIKFSKRLEKLVNSRRKQDRNHFYELVIGSLANEQYWLEAQQLLHDQSKIFDHLYELGRDGKWIREISV